MSHGQPVVAHRGSGVGVGLQEDSNLDRPGPADQPE